jgi:hypothetical protein
MSRAYIRGQNLAEWFVIVSELLHDASERANRRHAEVLKVVLSDQKSTVDRPPN